MKKIFYLGVVVLLLNLFLVGCIKDRSGNDSIVKQSGLVKVSSFAELTLLLNEKAKTKHYDRVYTVLTQTTKDLAPTAEYSKTPEYSTTNVQIQGVDEPDIVKSDGNYLYIISKSNLYIIRAHPSRDIRLVSNTILNNSPIQIFVNRDKLLVFSSRYNENVEPLSKCVLAQNDYVRCIFPYNQQTIASLYDISDRGMPKLIKEFEFEGQYFNARMIDNYVYIIITKPVYFSDKIPRIIPFGKLPEIYYFNETEYINTFAQVSVIDIENASEESKIFLLESPENIFVSQNNLYLTNTPEYDKTEIAKIEIKDGKITPRATGKVPGRVLNQFSMDEYNGYFRIATTTGSWDDETNNVYVLDAGMKIIGKLEGLAQKERIYSARFMNEKLYLVTFKKVDPLFVIDLKNPKEPKVLGKLKIPGYSDYLHPYDEHHLIGIGKETVEAKEGDFAWYQGIKISLFDVSDVEKPKEIAKYEIGDRGTDSEALRDHKAFLFDKKRGILVLPILLAEIDREQRPNASPSEHGDYVWQGAYVFNISEKGINLRGRVTHLKDDEELKKSGYYFGSQYSIKRSGYIENVLYTISDSIVKFNSLEDLEKLEGIVELD